MTREFVPYELAVKLKKLGFNEPCFFAFDNCSTPMRCTDLRTNEQKFEGVNYNSSTYTSQPTFSQAFRWFREKGFFVSFSTHDYNIHDFYIKWSIPDKSTLSESILSDAYDTYEEAELACLEELIEITETKKIEQ